MVLVDFWGGWLQIRAQNSEIHNGGSNMIDSKIDEMPYKNPFFAKMYKVDAKYLKASKIPLFGIFGKRDLESF